MVQLEGGCWPVCHEVTQAGDLNREMMGAWFEGVRLESGGGRVTTSRGLVNSIISGSFLQPLASYSERDCWFSL